VSDKLYILVRTDMKSMTPGRVAAQASHATSLFHTSKHPLHSMDHWMKEAQGAYGTVIVLACNKEQLLRFTGKAQYMGLVIDPEYVVMDGEEVVVAKDVLTCGFIFLPEYMQTDFDLSELKLY